MNIAIIPHEGRHAAVDMETGRIMQGVLAIQTVQSVEEAHRALIELHVQFITPPSDWTEGTPLVEVPEQEVEVL